MHPAIVDNFQGEPRTLLDPLPTQLAAETMGMLQRPLVHPLLHTARGSHEGRAAQLSPITEPMTTVAASGNHHFLLTATIHAKQNGGPDDTAWHRTGTDPVGTITAADTTCLLTPPESMGLPELEDCYYRMLAPTEIQSGMGFTAQFEMWGPARNKVRALGNAVTPSVATWITDRLLAPLRGAHQPAIPQ